MRCAPVTEKIVETTSRKKFANREEAVTFGIKLSGWLISYLRRHERNVVGEDGQDADIDKLSFPSKFTLTRRDEFFDIPIVFLEIDISAGEDGKVNFVMTFESRGSDGLGIEMKLIFPGPSESWDREIVLVSTAFSSILSL